MTIQLNDEQCRTILTEGLQRGLYENGGRVPDEEKVRLEDATKLVEAAESASRNGNKSDNVNTILFIAQCDTKPLSQNSVEQKVTDNVAQGNTVIYTKSEKENNMHNGLDLSTLSDGVIEGLIVGLDKYPPSDQVEEDRKAYVEERERRKNATKSISEAVEEDPSNENEKAAGNTSSSISEQSFSQDLQAPEDTSGRQREYVSGTEDAGAFARAQTPETSEKGRKAKVKSIEEDGERTALIEQLTISIVKAHGVSPVDIDSLSSDQLKYILDNPDGPIKEDKMPVNEKEVEEFAQTNTEVRGGKVIGGVDLTPVDNTEKVITKADLGIDVEDVPKENTSGEISAEREKLESLVTGPMLKAYGRGRKEILSIGDNELRFMILNSDGKVSSDELEKARALDGPEYSPNINVSDKIPMVGGLNPNSSPKMVVTKEVPGPEVISYFLEVDSQEDDPQDNHGDAEQIATTENIKETVLSAREVRKKELRELRINSDNNKQNCAMEIIARENMPIPPSYANEEAPILPIDVSVITRDELFSLHAKFHACESRMLWIMCQEEDKFGDIEKLRKDREAIVGANVPFLGEDGKRNTNEYRDFQIASDSEVLSLGKEEHEIKKVVKRLKILCDNYHRDCERLSRQMSKYERERSDAPR